MNNTEHEQNALSQAIAEMYGDKELRWYQIAARSETIQALRDGFKRILIVLPTGTGKTLTLAAALGDVEMREVLGVKGRPLRVLFIAHVHRLLTQAERTFISDSNVEIILQSSMSDLPSGIEWDLAVVDEGHHEATMSIQYKLSILGDKPIIGLTATPERPDGMMLKFDKIVAPISREEAVAQGYLTRTKIHTIVDVPSKNKVALLSDVFTNFMHEMGQMMVFVKTKAEIVQLDKHLKYLGASSIALLDQTPQQLDVALNEFGQGKYQFVLNCKRISEGVDVPGCDSVMLGRTVGSYPLLNQIIGRASRPDTDYAHVWELIDLLSSGNLDTTVVTGIPDEHTLYNKERGQWVTRAFNYSKTNQLAPFSTQQFD